MKLPTTNYKLCPYETSPEGRQPRRGFTLIELLLVVTIIGILAAIVILAVNPSRQLALARNAQRRVDVNTILNAVYQHAIDNNGNINSQISTSVKEACASIIGGAGSSTCGAMADLEAFVASERYLVQIPTDPSGATTTFGTGYQVYKSVNGRVTVRAPGAEESAVITITR